MTKILGVLGLLLVSLAFASPIESWTAAGSANVMLAQSAVQSGQSLATQSTSASRIPKAPESCETVECQWWETLRAAADEVQLSEIRKTQTISEAYAKARREGRIPNALAPLPPESEVVPPELLARLYSDIELATATYLKTINQGAGNSYRIPVADSSPFLPVMVRKQKAKYTEEARAGKIQGPVVLSAIFQADGAVSDIKVVRGLEKGLTEQAIEAAKGILFLPAIRDGKFVSMRSKLEFNFMLY